LAEVTKDLTDLVWSSECPNDPRVADHPWLQAKPGLQSVVVVPLRKNGTTIGGFLLGWIEASRRITVEERELLSGMAQAASVAVGNADLVDAARRHEANLQALLDTSRALSRIQPLDSLLQQIASACARLLGSPSVGIHLAEGDELVLRATVGDAQSVMLTPRVKIGAGLPGRVVETGEPLMVIDPADDPRHIASHRTADRKFGYGAWLGVPMKNGRTLGLLAARTRRRSGFSDEEQSIATAFAAQAATAIDNARLYQEIESAYQELQQSRAQLTQSQKMEAIGRLAGGVAHDFNNLLTVMIGRLYPLGLGRKPGDPLAGEFKVIEQAAFRAAALTRQLLAFSRKQVLQLKALEVNAMVNELARC
jgi:GAF domain-containing protein